MLCVRFGVNIKTMEKFALLNKSEREYFESDFSPMAVLLERIRQSLLTGEKLNFTGINLSGLVKFNPSESLTYITLFQQGKKFIRYGSKRNSFAETLNRDIEMLRKNKSFSDFDVADSTACRIMLEYVTDRTPVELEKLHTNSFDKNRFEIGINGLELYDGKTSYYYMPTDAVTLSHLSLNNVLANLAKKSPIGKMTNKISERLKILFDSKDYQYFLFKSKAFISYKDTCLPLYRGNILYDKFDYTILREQFLSSVNWLIDNMYDDGRFLYYYDCCDDTLKDHEHPARKEDNLYYNDLRHCGGTITLLRAYELTNESKYLDAAKKAINWSISILKSHETNFGKGYYAFYNNKAKLGGTGVLLISLMHYRNMTGDKTFDDYIKGCVCHILSRVHESGEMMGYYIHPEYQNGQPLIDMTDVERKETFSFYYPGEALFGLALFVNNFDDEKLVSYVKTISYKALDWIVEERPKHYSEFFTALPSDAWLMQAIEEWTKNDEFLKESYVDFVFNDALVMIDKMYREDDSPYIDYEGGFYYEYGDHFFPDGARSEGLIAAYYLAKRLGNVPYAERILQACKTAAKCQFHLFNSDKNNYSHKNQAKSLNSIRFKATRQWVRVDSIQHVACFFARLEKVCR